MASANRERIREVLLKMKEGKTIPQIAEELQVSPNTVSRLASKKHVDTALEMMQLADSGWTLQEIGDKFGVTRQWVSQLIGTKPRVGSTGHSLTINMAKETWDALQRVADDHDIPVYGGDRIDTRALVLLFDAIASGELGVVRVRRK